MVKFIVDSTFCLTKEMAQQNDVKVVSLKLVMDGMVEDEGYIDTWDAFYEKFAASTEFPTTSQPNAESYMDAINEIYAVDPNAEIVILTIGSCLSGTINSANIACQAYSDKKIAVVDSMNATISCTLMIEELLEYAKTGKTFDEVVEYAKDVRDRLSIQFIPDTMKYLRRGGRIGALGALIASIVAIKPIFDLRKNIVSVPVKALGLAKGVSAMVKRLPEKIKRLYVGYIGDNKNIPLILERLETLLGIKDVSVRAVDPVFGIHVGIGAIGIACLEG